MRWTTKWSSSPSGEQRGAAAPPRCRAARHNNKNGCRCMPSRGYRKGVSDGAIPSPLRVHTRLPHAIHAALRVDAVSRNVTASRIVREVVAAHYAGTPAVLPNRRGASSDLLRQLARIGNNLNQIAHEAHLMRLPLLERETRAALAELRDVLGRL